MRYPRLFSLAAVACLLLAGFGCTLPNSAQETHADGGGQPVVAASVQESESTDNTKPELKLIPLEATAQRRHSLRRKLNPEAADAHFVDGGPIIEWRNEGKTYRVDPATYMVTEAPESAEVTPSAATVAIREYLKAQSETPDDPELVGKLKRLHVEERGVGALVNHNGDLLYWSEAGGVRVIHLASQGKAVLEGLSPDGTIVSFVQEGDLHLVSGSSGQSIYGTSDGATSQGNILNGKLDWMYQEEIYGRGNWLGHWWSPDSTHMTYLRFDQTRVDDFTVIDFLPPDGSKKVGVDTFKYPKAGTPIPVMALIVVNLDGASCTIDLSGYGKQEHLVDELLIVDVSWSPSGRLFFQVQDRIQSWLDLNEADPTTGKVHRFFREESEDWVDRLESPRWLADGSFLWESQRSGYRHLYHYSAQGVLLNQITGGNWDAQRILKLDDRSAEGKGATIWFYANKEQNICRDLYRVELDGSGMQRLTDDAGWHSVEISDDGKLVIDKRSLPGEAEDCLLIDGKTGSLLKVLDQADISGLAEYALSPTTYERVACRDGYEIDVTMVKPVGFDETMVYPVWMEVYTGPDLPSIRAVSGYDTFQQFLAQRGYIILEVNVRSAGHNGHAISKQCYRAVGQTEMRDLEDVAKWIGAKSWADASKIGICGHSYGGFITGICLTNSTLWALGIAQSGVYDWRGYDAVYTERYMGTPQSNKEGYDAASAIVAAKNLSGHLVLTHGTDDENAHMQGTLQFAYALQKANKDFEMMIYPEQRHGYGDQDIYWWHRQMMWRQIQRWLPSPVKVVEPVVVEEEKEKGEESEG